MSDLSKQPLFQQGYEKGREDERTEWERAAAELLVKYSGDIYEAMPEMVREIQNNAIDNLLNRIKTEIFYEERTDVVDFDEIEEIAELIKGEKNEE